MRPAVLATPLVNLARSRDPGDRERLLAKLADLCETRARPLPPIAASEVEAVFLALVSEAGPDVRARIAERIARSAWPPISLVETLARDDIEVARPLLAASPRLGDRALMGLVREASGAHRLEIARRPLISAQVAAALVDLGDPQVLAGLAANTTAHIEARAMARLVGRVRSAPGLAGALAVHPRLTPELAVGLWAASDPMTRRGLEQRFGLDPAAQAPAAGDDFEPARTDGPGAAEIRLVDKLAASGRLRPGYLMKTLQDRQLGLFEAALARLGGFELGDVRRAVSDPSRPELLALACAAVGLDRSVFPTLLGLVRECAGGLPGGGEDSARRAAGAFEPFTPDLAASAFRLALGGV